MQDQFEWALGSVTGREHQRLGRGSQDAVCALTDDRALVAVVCDGCGSHPHSEVGAKLGARWVATTLLHEITNPKHGQDSARLIQEQTDHDPKSGSEPLEESLKSNFPAAALKQRLLEQIDSWATPLGDDRPQVLADYFLFTVVGVVIQPHKTTVFAWGDGVIWVNGAAIAGMAVQNNAPPYPAYELLKPQGQTFWWQQWPTATVQSLMIGTDGVEELIARADRPLPGKTEPVGDISQFWQQDCYFKNPDQVRRRLALINREVVQPDWGDRGLVKSPGLLADDTTLVVIRRRPPVETGEAA